MINPRTPAYAGLYSPPPPPYPFTLPAFVVSLLAFLSLALQAEIK